MASIQLPEYTTVHTLCDTESICNTEDLIDIKVHVMPAKFAKQIAYVDHLSTYDFKNARFIAWVVDLPQNRYGRAYLAVVGQQLLWISKYYIDKNHGGEMRLPQIFIK